MYQLQAFPTLSVLKDFIPYRGIIFSSEIELPHAEMKALHDLEFTSLESSPLLNQKPLATILIDTGPVLELIAKEWKYDLDLLKEGKGDTGIEDHSWTMYSNNKISPVIVRWSMGKARIHLVMGNDRMQFKCIAIGNVEAKDVLERLTVILGTLNDDSDFVHEVDVATDDTVQKIKVGNAPGMSDFSTECFLVTSDDDNLNEIRRKDCAQLVNSCNLIMFKEKEIKDTQLSLKANEMFISITNISRSFKYSADVSCSWEIYNIIYGLSVLNAGREMNRIICRALDPEKAQRFDTALERQRFEPTPRNDDPEMQERKNFLGYRCKDIIDFIASYNPTTMMNSKRWRKITIGGDFKNPELSILKGTSSFKTLVRGEVVTGPDLIVLLIDTVMNLRTNLPNSTKAKATEKKMKIKGRVDGVNRTVEAPKEFDYKLETISDPYFSLHMGMPIRIDQSLSIWRKDDGDALACDIWFDIESGHLHLENLYRVKIPTA